MKKIILYWATLLILLLSACHKEEILPETENKTGKTITLSATFPGNEPTTKVALEQQEDKTIALTWDQGDTLQLAFVKEGKTTVKDTVIIRDISPNGKNAQFDITLPVEYESGTFDLYGVYGGGGIDITGPNPVAVLPTNAGSATSLNHDGGVGILDSNSVQKREDVMLYFASTGIDVNAPNISVTFTHLGSLFSVDIFNDSGGDLLFSYARLVGVNETTGVPLEGVNWAYNSLAGGKKYDLVTGQFQEPNSGSNYISFSPLQTTLPTGNSITLWAWYPPLSINWPALKLSLYDNGEIPLVSTIDHKPARQSPTPAGKAFYFYAGYFNDGNGGRILEFLAPVDEYHVEYMGDLSTIIPDAKKTTITRLRLTGSLNAADFIFMKNHMPNIEFLDISETTCDNNSIPTQAFGDQNAANAHKKINEIMLPNSITEIGAAAFANCTGISEMIMLPPNVTIIREGAFIGCANLKNVELHNAIVTIEKGAFAACTSLHTINTTISEGVTSTLPTGLITIGEDAFNGCVGLSSPLTLPNTLTTLGARAFYSCGSLPLENNVLTIPEGITTIGDEAFFMCSNFIGTVSLPSTLQIIGKRAFHRCLQLNGPITIPASVTTIRDFAFAGYNAGTEENPQIHGPSFSSLTFASGSQLESLGAGAFSYCWNLAGGLNLSTTTKLDTIPYGAFAVSFLNGPTAGGLTLQNNLKVIGEDAFAGSGFTGALSIPNSVNTIRSGAFSYCEGFTGSLDLSNTGLTEITWGAFGGCTGLTGALTLPTNITAIGDEAFRESGFTGPLNIPNSVASIGAGAFGGCTGLSSLALPVNLVSIGESAFEWCIGINNPIEFQTALTSIGARGFYGCTSIPSFTFNHTSVFPYAENMFWKDSAGGGSVIMTTPIYVEQSLVATYKVSLGWIDHEAYISAP